MSTPLEELLSLFLRREQLAPGVHRVSLAVGDHLVGVEVRDPGGSLALRAFPLEALPDALAKHPQVKERITHFGDLVNTGKLGRDETGRPMLEVDLATVEGSRETYFGILEGVAIDCARLRGAAEGLVAALELCAQQAGPAPASPPAKKMPPLDQPGPGRGRLWESVLQQSLSPSLQKHAQQRREEQSGSLKAAAEAELGSQPPDARLAEAAPGPLPRGAEPAPAAEAEPMLVTHPAGAHEHTPLPKHLTPDPLPAAKRPSPEKAVDGAPIIFGARPKGKLAPALPARTEKRAPAGASPPAASWEDLERELGGSSAVAPAPPLPPAPQGERRHRAEILRAEPQGHVGTPSSAAPPLTGLPSHGSGDLATASGLDAALAPEEPLAPLLEPDGGLIEEAFSAPVAARRDDRRPKKSGFFEAPSEAEPPGLIDGFALSGGAPASAPAAPSAIDRSTSPLLSPAERRPQEGEPVFGAPPSRGAPPGPRLPRAAAPPGDEEPGSASDVLSWMDSVAPEEHGEDAESAPVDGEEIERRVTAFVPKPLATRLKEQVRDWYRRADRESIVAELKKGGDLITLSAGEAVRSSPAAPRGVSLRISRPPVEVGERSYQPEPLELSYAEVEGWLLARGLVDEEEVGSRRAAQALMRKIPPSALDADVDDARARLAEVLERLPEDPAALTAMGHLHRKLGARDEAESHYERALKKAPKYATALLGKAALLLETDRHKAFEEAMSALALSPRDPEVLALAGFIALRASRKARARELFFKVYRIDRTRGEAVIEQVDPERSGEAKLDPRLVVWERKALERGGADAHHEELYRERLEVAKRFDDYLKEHPQLDADARCSRISKLAEIPSYGFLADLLSVYAAEESEEVRTAIEAAFSGTPTQAAAVLEDAVLSGDAGRAAAALSLGLRCGHPEVVKPALEVFRHVHEPRDVEAFARELGAVGGADPAMALVAKLEAGGKECLAPLVALLNRRSDEPAAEEAAATVFELLDVAKLEDAPRRALYQAAGGSAREADRSASLKKVQRKKRLKELEEELGGKAKGEEEG